MVKNRNIRGRSGRSSGCKAKKPITQIESGLKGPPPPPDEPAECDVPADPPEPQTAGHGPPGLPDRVYLVASAVFQNNHLEKPAARRVVNYGDERGIPLPEVRDEEMRRAAFELAFNTLKYQELLEDIMIDSCFYFSQPIPDGQMGLAAVMLYDFQDRKFLLRERRGEEEVVQDVRDVENSLLRFRTKLVASLARCRIKHNLLSIECILPERVKMKQERSSSLPLYTWVNTLKSSPGEVQRVLGSSGFSQVGSIGQLEGQTFCRDPHCGDVLVFPGRLRPRLCSTELLRDHTLVVQDKSCSLGPNIVCAVLPEEGDVLMVGCFSGLTVSHTASLVAEKHKDNSSSSDQPTVYACVSDRTDAQREDLRRAVADMGCKNVELIPVAFQSLDGADKRLQRVRVILLTPKCSVSAVSNPVEFILQENGDTDLLQDLSQGSIAQSKLEALVAQQKKDIGHALKFPKVLAVVYSTCSSYPEENEEVVSGALEQAKAHSEREGEPKQADFRQAPVKVSAHLRRALKETLLRPSPFGPLDSAEGPEETGPSLFTLEPSDQSNGCFLAVLIREPEPVVKEVPQEVLARANAKGLLDKIGSVQPTRKEQHRHKSRAMTTTTTTKAAQARTPQPLRPAGVQPRHRESKGIDCAPPGGHQDLTDVRRQSSQAQPRALRLQARKSNVSIPVCTPEQESSCSSSSRPENSITSVSTTTTTLRAAPLPAAARPRRAHHVVLKPVVFVLPPVLSPNFSPPHNSQAGFNPNFNHNNKWRTPPPPPPQTLPLPLPPSSGGRAKETILKSRRLFLSSQTYDGGV